MSILAQNLKSLIERRLTTLLELQNALIKSGLTDGQGKLNKESSVNFEDILFLIGVEPKLFYDGTRTDDKTGNP